MIFVYHPGCGNSLHSPSRLRWPFLSPSSSETVKLHTIPCCSRYFVDASVKTERQYTWSLSQDQVQDLEDLRSDAHHCTLLKYKSYLQIWGTVLIIAVFKLFAFCQDLPVPCPRLRISPCKVSSPCPGHCSGWCSSSHTFQRTETCSLVLQSQLSSWSWADRFVTTDCCCSPMKMIRTMDEREVKTFPFFRSRYSEMQWGQRISFLSHLWKFPFS